jgi:two-component system sensor kinase FixL
MKTESGHTLPIDTSAVWANEPAQEPIRRARNDFSLVLRLAAVVMLAAIAASGFFYWSGLQGLRTQAAQVVDKGLSHTQPPAQAQVQKIVDEAGQLAWRTAAAAASGGLAALLVVAVGSYWANRRARPIVNGVPHGPAERIQELEVRLAETALLQETTTKELIDTQESLATLSATHASVVEELALRKQSEKSLTQQAQKLERSKDVLEMHVRARTQELEKLQHRNELILNSAGDGICGFDLQGRATFVNPAAARISGCRVDEMVGKSEEEIFYPLKYRGGDRGPGLARNELGGIAPQQTFFRKDGTCYPVEYMRTPIRENERTVGSVVMFKDITERKLSEDALSHKAAELARSNGELEQFAFVASHDLQEPLRKIQAFGDRLKVKCDGAQLQEGRDYLDRMQNAAARMQTLINDLLTFSRVISAKQPFVPVDLQAVTGEVLADLEVRIEKTGGVVNVGKLPTIDADPTQMRQLLQNLIGNALKFQPAGAAPRVDVEAQLVTRDQIQGEANFPNPPPSPRLDDKFCVLTVKDNGIGFDEQYLEKIFAVFQRLHGRSEYEGTGVGLAVCRRITDRHGGLITAQSKTGAGAKFIVILPARHPKPEESQ